MRYRGEDFAVLLQPRDCRDLRGLSCNIRAEDIRRCCDRVIKLDRGRIVADGPIDAVMPPEILPPEKP